MERYDVHNPEDMRRYWQENLEVGVGMLKEEALDRFRSWREKSKTCDRCGCEDLVDFCPVLSICREANNERSIEGNDNRERVVADHGIEAKRAVRSQKSEAASLRKIERPSPSIPRR